MLTFQQSCFKKNECHCQNSVAFYEWQSISTFWVKQQAQYFSLSAVRASWTVWTGKMKGQHHWEDKARLFSVPTLSYCVHVVMLLMCFRDLNLKLMFSSQKPTHWQVITEEMWDSWVGVVGFVPAPRRWQMWGSSPPYLSLLCYLSRPSRPIFRHECILKIKRDTFSLWCSRNSYMRFGNRSEGIFVPLTPYCNVYFFWGSFSLA